MNPVETVEIKPKRIDIKVGRKNDVSFDFILGNAKDEPFDISTDDVQFDIFSTVGAAPIISKTSLAGSHLDPLNGTVLFTITDAELSSAGASDTKKTFWYYSLSRTTLGGDLFTHLCGSFTTEPCS